jgi:hypothetical protein
MSKPMKTAVATLFHITQQIKQIDQQLSKDEEVPASLLNRKRLVRALESKSSLLETAVSQVEYIKHNLGDCVEMKSSQIDLILQLVSLCDTMAVAHIRKVSDLEVLVEA